MVVFVCLFFAFSNVKEGMNPTTDPKTYHIVCAKYQRPCDFLNDIPISHTVITKGDDVANEATSFLYYILRNYEELPPNVVFIHDENGSWHHDGNITERIFEWIDAYQTEGATYYEFNNMDNCKYGTMLSNPFS